MTLQATPFKLLFALVLCTLAITLTAQDMDGKLPLGTIDREMLEQNEPYASWFTKEYDNYKVDAKAMKACAPENHFKDYRVIIVLGTWCEDSRREVPRFYKVLDHLLFPSMYTRIILVDKNKKDDKDKAEKLNIEYVPTFIVTDRNGKELGRIVEKPTKSLESDLCELMK